MPANARLLVHAGASTTHKDDNLRKAQLQAYLDLETAHVSRRLDLESLGPAVHDAIGADRDMGLLDNDNERPPDITTFIDDTQLAYTALESQLFFFEPTRPRVRQEQLLSGTAGHSSQASSRGKPCRDASLEEQRSELDSINAERPSKRARLEYTKPLASSPAYSYSSAPALRNSKRRHSSGEAAVSNNDAGFSIETTSELPTTYSLSDLASDSLKSRPRLTQRSASYPGRTSSSVEKTSALTNSPQASPSVARPVSAPSREIRKSGVPDQTTGLALPRELAEVVPDPATIQAMEDLRTLSTSIHPPPAATSLARFTTHITPALQRLADDPGLSSVFLPVSSSREIAPLERGHWLVDCPGWTVELQAKFWRTLDSIIGQGNAGWGVWCSRGKEVPLAAGSQSAQSRPDQGMIEFGPVRIFCWGEIVKHVYLLLYLSSSSKVRKLGLQWIDAEGLVVVQMPGAVQHA